MRKSFLAVLTVIAAAVFLTACGTKNIPQSRMAEAFTVHKVFGSHMVLQRQKPVTISGTAPSGQIVKAAFAGKTVYAKANRRGEWIAVFPAMEAGGPYVLEISGKNGAEKVVFHDILLGEVWICSGQSNMQMPVKSGGAFWSVKNADEEVKNANYPQIRLFNVNHTVSPGVIQNEIQGTGWMACTPESVQNFSGAGYFFGRQIHKDLNVPVGLIHSSWGGTKIEPWISEAGYRTAKRKAELDMIKAARVPAKEQAEKRKAQEAKRKKQEQIFEAQFEKWMNNFYHFNLVATAAAKDWKNPALDDGKWGKAILPGGFPEGQDGIAWFRHTVQLPADWAGKELTLSLGPVDDCDETFFNGEKVGETTYKVKMYWSKPRVYTVPGKFVKAGKNVIAIRVADHFSNGGLNGGDTQMFLQLKKGDSKKISIADAWKVKLEYAVDINKLGVRPTTPSMIQDGIRNPSYPATLFNSMIAPWTKYPVRGAIWYQGCSNAGNPDYYPLHKLLINDWRRQWKNKKMPFILVQLAGYEGHRPKNRLPDHYWMTRPFSNQVSFALTREIQAEMLELPDTGMAVAMDIGDHSDIHPADKQTVGYRLAMEAERIAYGSKKISQGPKFKNMKIENGKIRVVFDNVGKGLATKDGKKPGAFAIAGKDGKFVWADAVIDGNTVVVSSPLVKEPAQVRYAWTMYRGDVNLCNKDGFAAIPFRSDKPAYQ